MGEGYAYVNAATLNPVTVKQYTQHRQIHAYARFYFLKG